jgi:hypothetical protein
MKIKQNLLATIVGVLLISGCAKYRPQPLELPQAPAQEKDGIEVQAAVLDSTTSKHIFGQRSPRSKGYIPIHVAVTNKTSQTYELDAWRIGLELVPANHVARQIEFNTAGRVAGWGIAGLFFAPLFIPAFVEGYKSTNANRKLARDLEKRAISDYSKIVIKPHGTINRVMFVSTENYKPTFDLEVVSPSTGKNVKFTLNV